MNPILRYVILTVCLLSLLTMNCDCVYCVFCPNCDYCDSDEDAAGGSADINEDAEGNDFH